VFIRAIDKALEKPAPDLIPLSVPRALENDFCSVTLQNDERNIRVLVRQRNGSRYNVLVWRGDGDGAEETWSKQDIEDFDFNLRIERYFQGYQFSYRRPEAFLFFEFLQWRKFIKIKDRVSQNIYNRRRLVREERIDLLQYIVERKIENPRDQIHPLMLAVDRYSRKWLYHPDKNRHKAHLQLVLDSFLDSGELRMNEQNYVVTGRALVTLAEYEVSVQRHKDQINTAKSGNRLTTAIIFIGVASIASQLTMWAIDRGLI
jgi:hypothetical protein